MMEVIHYGEKYLYALSPIPAPHTISAAWETASRHTQPVMATAPLLNNSNHEFQRDGAFRHSRLRHVPAAIRSITVPKAQFANTAQALMAIGNTITNQKMTGSYLLISGNNDDVTAPGAVCGQNGIQRQ